MLRSDIMSELNDWRWGKVRGLCCTIRYSTVLLFLCWEGETSAVSSSISHTRVRHQIIIFIDVERWRFILQIYITIDNRNDPTQVGGCF